MWYNDWDGEKAGVPAVGISYTDYAAFGEGKVTLILTQKRFISSLVKRKRRDMDSQVQKHMRFKLKNLVFMEKLFP